MDTNLGLVVWTIGWLLFALTIGYILVRTPDKDDLDE